MAVFPLHIVSPREDLFEGDAVSLSVMTTSGMITVLPNHTPLVSVVGKGTMTVKTKNGEVQAFKTAHGVIDVRPSQTVVIVHNGE